MFETFIPECMRGSGDENDFLLKGYVKQVADHKGSRAEYGFPSLQSIFIREDIGKTNMKGQSDKISLKIRPSNTPVIAFRYRLFDRISEIGLHSSVIICSACSTSFLGE